MISTHTDYSQAWFLRKVPLEISERTFRSTYILFRGGVEMLDCKDRPVLVVGDVNFCYLTSGVNQTKQFLISKQFTQIIKEPTHIEGHLLDQAYMRDCNETLSWTVEVQSKYYTDHKGLAIIIKENI